MRIPIKWAQARFYEFGGGLPRAWLHGVLNKLENGNYVEKWYIEQNNPILPNNFEFHCAELLACRCLELEVLGQLKCPL